MSKRSKNSKKEGEENEPPYFETVTFEKFYDGNRMKFMSFTIKCAEKSDLMKTVMDLLIRISEHRGYMAYFNTDQVDPFAAKASLPTEKNAGVDVLIGKWEKELKHGLLFNQNSESYINRFIADLKSLPSSITVAEGKEK